MRPDPSKSIPTTDSAAEQWVTWHKLLKKWFGKNEANDQWLRFWNQRAGAGSNADTNALREYMKTQGVDLTTTTWGEIQDSAQDVAEWFGDTINWGRGLIIAGVITGIVLIAFYVIYNTTKGKSAAEMVSGIPKPGRSSSANIPLSTTGGLESFDGIDFTSAAKQLR